MVITTPSGRSMSFNGAVPVKARKASALLCGRRPIGRFNGAVPVKARKGDLYAAIPMPDVELQWGRAC